MNNSVEYLLDCEAKEWRRLVSKHGRAWWNTHQKPRLIKKRGEKHVVDLCKRMNEVNK